MTFKEFIRLTFSENGTPSAKRVVGFLGYLVALGCIIALTIRDGGTVIVQDLIQTLLITSTSLLGLYSITSIWKRGNISIGKETESTESTEVEE